MNEGASGGRSLVGHHSARSANKLTYGLYSAGISDEQKRGIVESRGIGRLNSCHSDLFSGEFKLSPQGCTRKTINQK